MATFTGTNGAEVLPDLIIGPVQGIGNDFVDALGGDDIAIGWSGDDVIRGGAGADVIIGGLLNAAGVITNSGIDAADYTTSVDGVTIDLSVTVNLTLPMQGINLQLTNATQGFGGDAQGDYLVGITNLIGSNTGGDNLTGNAGANTFNGQGGNDILNGQGGNDILLGGAGDDVLIGGAGADSLQGGAGTADTADYSGSASAVTVNLTTGTGSGGDAQGDTLTGIERLIGSAHADSLTGSAGNDVLIGLDGADALIGNGGTDTADYTASTAGVIVSLEAGTGAGGHAEGDTLTGIENLTGSAFADTLTGTDADVNVLNGGDGDDILAGLGGGDTLIGGLGSDTADYTASTAGVIISLEAATATGGHAVGDTLTSIENLTGSAFTDTLTGTDAGANVLNGGDGNDALIGLGGADTLIGGAGTDTANYIASTAGVIVNLDTGTGSGGHAEGDTLTGIENLIGSSFDDTLTGTDTDANILTGGAGNDVLAGLGGADTLDGGVGGSDTADYTASTAGVIISLETGTAAGGHAEGDTLTSIENLTGSAFADTLTGTDADANTLNGGNGDDVLIGLGGADTLIGGLGSDTADYTASTAGIIINLEAGTAAGGHAEGDTLTGIENLTGSAFDDTLTGTDAGANTLNGGVGNDLLDGLGGNDTLIGGLGDDIFFVDAAGDQAIELVGEGTDTVRSSVSWTLSDNIERLELQGVGNINAVGNILDNTIVGNAGNNTIDGGLGNDTLIGGTGDDIYVVSSSGDRIIEVAGEGRDTIRSSIDWTIGADIERLELQGSGNLTGNGNTLANTVGGNSGNNILRGGAGNDTLAGYLGNDRLVGGEGKDTFVFNTVLGPNNVDTITDYNVADDMIQLDKGIFFGLAAGWLSAAAFHIGTAAHDASDRIIFNSTTGGLFFDKDGIGGAAATQFATLTPGLAMNAGEFFVA